MSTDIVKVNAGETKPHIKDNVSALEPPQSLKWHQVMYWEPKCKMLLVKKANGDTQAATMLSKAEKLLQYNCIEKIGNIWKIKPIKGYNSTTYDIHRGLNSSMDLICNCQGWSKNGNCSHCLGVRMFEYMEEHNGKSM